MSFINARKKRPGRTAGHYEQNDVIIPHGAGVPANAMPGTTGSSPCVYLFVIRSSLLTPIPVFAITIKAQRVGIRVPAHS